MSENIEQLYTANPTTTFVSTDLMYLGRAPYTTGDDFAFTYASLAASLASGSGSVTAGTINDIAFYGATGNVLSAIATVDNAVFTTNATGVPGWNPLTNGQLVIGSSSGAPLAGTITAGTNISVTNAANSITIATTGAGSFTWVDQTSSTVTMAINTGYITDNGATLVTYTLPTTAALGSIFEIAGKSAGGWTLVYSTGQSIGFGSVTTTATTGSLSSSNPGDCIRFVCTTANTGFRILSVVGNINSV